MALNLAARLLMSLIFIISGWGKLVGYSGTQGYFAPVGIPLSTLMTPLDILIEFGGGLALLFGLKARWAADVLALFAGGPAFDARPEKLSTQPRT